MSIDVHPLWANENAARNPVVNTAKVTQVPALGPGL